MPERAQHGLAEGDFVPRTIVAPAVDEERGRNTNAARLGAGDVGVHAGLAPCECILLHGRRRCLQLRSHRVDIVVGQRGRARHQVHVTTPERSLVGGGLRDIGRAAREITAGQRPLPKYVAQAIAEAIAQLRDLLVRSAAVGTRVAAVFDQRDVAVVGTEHMVVARVDRPVEPAGVRCLGHCGSGAIGNTRKTSKKQGAAVGPPLALTLAAPVRPRASTPSAAAPSSPHPLPRRPSSTGARGPCRRPRSP